MWAIWQKRNSLSYLLWPLSFVYRFFIFLRNKLYRLRLIKINRFSIPIIVVGNITVGGTGKTPVVIALAEFFKEKGWRPGIISRGYKGKIQRVPHLVRPYNSAREVGDEPLLIALQTACPTVIDPNRCRGVKHLIEYSRCNLILSDDGLQHRKLGRNIEIVVLDGKRRLGNQFCLPAGPLREPSSRLKTVDFILTKGTSKTLINESQFFLIPYYAYQLIYPENKKTLQYFYGKEVHAVAGIGNPDQFFNSLDSLGLNIITHSFPDHHSFRPSDFNFGDKVAILMTEKDAVKCNSFSDPRLWGIAIKTQLENDFLKKLYEKVKAIDNIRAWFSNTF